MTIDEIREVHATLTQVGGAVEVPVVDRLAFQTRVRAERRRRTARRSLVAAAAAVTAVGSVLAFTSTGGGNPDGASDLAASSGPAGADLHIGRVPLAVKGGFLELLRDGSSYEPGQLVEEVLGSTPGGVVVLDHDSRLLLLPLASSGQPGEPQPLAGGAAVQSAWLDKSGEFLGFVDLDNRLHLRRVDSSRDTASMPLLTAQTQLMATDGTRWVEDEGDRLSLRTPEQSFEIISNANPTQAELAGDTLAVHTTTGIEFYDSADGTRRFGNLGGTTGSLSPDGTTYAAGPNDVERDAGMRPALFVMDTSTGDEQRISGFAADLSAEALAWQNDDDFLVMASSTIRTGNRVLFSCSVSSRACVERYDDSSGTMQIPSQ